MRAPAPRPAPALAPPAPDDAPAPADLPAPSTEAVPVTLPPAATVSETPAAMGAAGIATAPSGSRIDRAVPSTPGFKETVRLSERVIDHLRRQPRTGPYDIALATMTQAGMVEALGASQSALAKVLRRLVASGVLLESREHAQGAPTRLKVYRLTPLGEALARDIRQRRRVLPIAARGSARVPSDAWVVPHPKG